ncbi:hypothetical protein [Planctomicrobium sp. SH527]|uniref:hypothetical protein n=1 Tax=Planctomicrobium sp. SH527 TaxID=3448123 RepID=UPI003F5C9C85
MKNHEPHEQYFETERQATLQTGNSDNTLERPAADTHPRERRDSNIALAGRKIQNVNDREQIARNDPDAKASERFLNKQF